MHFQNLSSLYQFLDDICIKEIPSEHYSLADELFATSYIRGFISFAAAEYGDDSQVLTKALADDISEQIQSAKSELTPQDQYIIKQYWQELKKVFIA
ncbi:MAG: hypothetical protein ACI9LM_004380 [Alteromonadaceae bacterium]|jgi:hypothetical protein